MDQFPAQVEHSHRRNPQPKKYKHMSKFALRLKAFQIYASESKECGKNENDHHVQIFWLKILPKKWY